MILHADSLKTSVWKRRSLKMMKSSEMMTRTIKMKKVPEDDLKLQKLAEDVKPIVPLCYLLKKENYVELIRHQKAPFDLNQPCDQWSKTFSRGL